MTDQFVPFGSEAYFCLLVLLLFSRGMDFLSTWIATPNLLLEANPIARRLGWRMGIALNVAICIMSALWPLPAIILVTTSLLVASRNFQVAWLIRSMGENGYRFWYAETVSQIDFSFYVFCLFGQTLLVALIGGALTFFSGNNLIVFAVGMGMVAYSIVVMFFTLYGARHLRRPWS